MTMPLTTVADVLDASDTGQVAAALADAGALATATAHLAGVGRQLVVREVAGAVAGALDVDLETLLVGGWQRYRDLATAARRTRDEPGSEEFVPLATHRITSSHEFDVELYVDEAKVSTLDFELMVTCEVDALVAAVRSGALVGVSAGRCTVAAELTFEGSTLVEREASVALSDVARLERPVPILDGDDLASSRAPDAILL